MLSGGPAAILPVVGGCGEPTGGVLQRSEPLVLHGGAIVVLRRTTSCSAAERLLSRAPTCMQHESFIDHAVSADSIVANNLRVD